MKAKPEHQIAFQEINGMLKRMADEHQLTSLQLLAVAGNLVGKLVALQDQRYVSPDRAMSVFMENFKLGNRQAVEELMKSQGEA